MKLKPLDILFIEDCQEDIDLAKEVLKDEKIKNRFKIINDGEEAMSYLKKGRFSLKHFPPDVIVLDLNIPKKNGFEVLKEIISDQELKKIPLIVFTTSDLSRETLQKYKLDFRHYVRKSLDFHEFVEAIKAIEAQDQKRKAPLDRHPLSEDTLNILLIEDNIEDAELIEELLLMKQKNHWHIKHFQQLQEALIGLKRHDFDVVILDLFLPDMRGLKTLKKFIAYKNSIPIIVMTSLKDERIGKDAIREGAQDYLVKGQITSDFFIRAVEHAIERKKLEQLKDELLSYVNHELSNPLAVIKESFIQMREGLFGDINSEQKQFLDISLSSIDRLTKLALGKLLIEKETFIFNELVHEVMETFKASFIRKGLELKSLLPDKEIKLYADRGRIGQVLTNLLNNALKCTSTGRAEIVVEERGDEIHCAISDTGQGIAAEDIPKLFQKYGQILSRNRKDRRSTGLGLFICKTLIELHGGHIQAESRLGKGTKFIFTLPKK
jgi:signal transduction histidine kinase